MRFKAYLGVAPPFLAAFVLTGTLAAAAGEMTGGSMMKADGTMLMSPSLMKMADTVKSASGCRTVTAEHVRCFKVRIDNISRPNGFVASNGTKWTLPFSPGVFVVTANVDPIFSFATPDRGHGLRAQSEDGDPAGLFAYVSAAYPGSSGAFLVPVGGSKPKGILPGQRFEFYVLGAAGQRLHFTTMHGQSNDWFYGTPNGIALFDPAGNAIGGDVTAQVRLFDAGTEADQELGIGSTQGPRQPHPRFGPADRDAVLRFATSDPRFVDATKVMRVTVTPQ